MENNMDEQELYNDILDLVTVVRNCKAQIEAIEAELKPTIDTARVKLEQLGVEYRDLAGKNWEDELGYVRVRDAYERVSYDAGKLDMMLDRYDWLHKCRKVSNVKGGVTVK